MRKDYDQSDKTYASYIDLLNTTNNSHQVELSKLRNLLNEREGNIRDLSSTFESQKL